MADKVISATLKLNTGTAATDIGNVNKQLGKTTEELGGANETAKTTTSSFSTLKDGLGKLPGPLKSVTSGVESVGTSLKALAANPIVLVITLLVAALVALYKAFASTESGAEKIEQIFSGLGAIVTVIRDRILALAGAVVDFFKGNFSKAIEETKAAVTGVGDAIVHAYSEAADATRELQEANDELNRTLLVSRAKLERDLAQTKELITDQTANYKDRKTAIDEVRIAEDKQTQAELDNANKTLKALERKLALDKEDADLQDEYAKQQARVYEIQETQAQNIRSLNRQERQIDNEQQQKANEAAQKAHEANQKRLQEQAALEKELFEIHKQTHLLAQDDIITSADIAKEAADKKAAVQAEADKKEQERFTKQAATMRKLGDSALKKDVDATKLNVQSKISIGQGLLIYQKQALDVTSNLFASAANLAGKNSALGKAFAIAGATIDTYRGALAAFTGMTSSIPGPVGIALGIAAAAAAVANGLATVKQIISVKIPGGGDAGAGGSISNPVSNSVAAPVAPIQTGTAIDQNSIAGIGNAVSGRSYVLSQDVTHDQDRNERLNRSARLGG